MRHEATIFADSSTAADARRLLRRRTAEPGTKECDTIFALCGDFPSGHQADIKVCNGDTGPWVDAVLFEKNGNECAVCDPGYRLTGKHV